MFEIGKSRIYYGLVKDVNVPNKSISFSFNENETTLSLSDKVAETLSKFHYLKNTFILLIANSENIVSRFALLGSEVLVEGEYVIFSYLTKVVRNPDKTTGVFPVNEWDKSTRKTQKKWKKVGFSNSTKKDFSDEIWYYFGNCEGEESSSKKGVFRCIKVGESLVCKDYVLVN